MAAKEARGGGSKATWFLKGETTTTLTCTATPGSKLQTQLKDKLKTTVQADGGQTMVLEDRGTPATLGLKVRDPFRDEEYRFKDPSCQVSPSVDCSMQDQTYIITCNGCQEAVGTSNGIKPNMPGGEGCPNYIGMTGTSLHARAKAHTQSVRSGTQSNAIAKHTKTCHNGVAQGFTMKPMAAHRTVLSRYKAEGIYIEKQIPLSSLNNKTEGGRGGLVHLNPNINRC